jgi:outer membrane protein assembly factor BamB
MLKFVLLIFCAELASAAQAKLVFHPTDWPTWRGLHGDGHAKAIKGLPLKWSDSKNVVWKAKLPGRGHSTPTVVGNRIYLATAEEKNQVQSVLCFDKDTGKLIWSTAIHTGNFVKGGNKNASHASSAVVCDGTQLYVSFPNDKKIHTTALSMEGKVLWQTAVSDYVIHQGFGTSPTVYRDVVIAKADSKKIGGAVAGLNKKTGKVIWKIKRPKYPNYTTPVMITAYGKLQMVFAGAELITSIDPLTGKKHWEFPGSTQECVTTAVTDGKRIFVSGGWPKNHIAAIEADGSGKITWQNTARVYVPSMLMKDGHLYATMDAGFAVCWESATGKELWKERLGGAFFASPVLVGERIYATNLAGKTFVYSTDPKEFKLLATNQLGNEVYASPIVSGNRLYLRVAFKDASRQEWLYCIGK